MGVFRNCSNSVTKCHSSSAEAHKSYRLSANSITGDVQTSSGIKISTKCVQQELHSKSFQLHDRIITSTRWIGVSMLPPALEQWDHVLWSDKSHFSIWQFHGWVCIWQMLGEHYLHDCCVNCNVWHRWDNAMGLFSGAGRKRSLVQEDLTGRALISPLRWIRMETSVSVLTNALLDEGQKFPQAHSKSLPVDFEWDVIKAPVGLMSPCVWKKHTKVSEYVSCKSEVKLKAMHSIIKEKHKKHRVVKFKSKCYILKLQINLCSSHLQRCHQHPNTQTHKRLSGPPGVWPTLYLTCAFNTDNSMWYLLLVGGQKALRRQQRKRIRKKEVVKSGQLSGLRVICSTACNWFCVIVVMSDRY